MKSLGSCLTALTMSVATAIAADNPDQPYIVLSNGQTTCGEYLKDTELQVRVDVEWVLGYISGVNRFAPANTRMAGSSYREPEAVTAWLANYCRAHALDLLAKAADELRQEFIRREHLP